MFPPFALDPNIRSLKLNFNDLVQAATAIFAEFAKQEKHK